MGKSDTPKGAAPALRWSQRERLRYLEALAFWRGWVRRADLIGRFGIGMQHVSADIAEYGRLNPGALTYNPRKKLYQATPQMKPILGEPMLEEALTFLGKRAPLSGPWVAVVRLPERRTNRAVVQKVFRAASMGQSVRVRYASLNSKTFRWRWITPHAFASDGYRWHVRAFCHEENAFKDFVLGRIATAGSYGPPGSSPGDDVAWRNCSTIRLAPADGMNSAEIRALELDFGMRGGRLSFVIRDALRFYALAHAGLSEDGRSLPVRFKLADQPA